MHLFVDCSRSFQVPSRPSADAATTSCADGSAGLDVESFVVSSVWTTLSERACRMIQRSMDDFVDGRPRWPVLEVKAAMQACGLPDTPAFLECVVRFGGVHYDVRNGRSLWIYPSRSDVTPEWLFAHNMIRLYERRLYDFGYDNRAPFRLVLDDRGRVCAYDAGSICLMSDSLVSFIESDSMKDYLSDGGRSWHWSRCRLKIGYCEQLSRLIAIPAVSEASCSCHSWWALDDIAAFRFLMADFGRVREDYLWVFSRDLSQLDRLLDRVAVCVEFRDKNGAWTPLGKS